MSELTKDYNLAEVAEAMKMSERWVRQRIKDGDNGDGPFIVHGRRGNKIIFSADQVEAFRAQFVQSPPVVESVTTGRKRRAS